MSSVTERFAGRMAAATEEDGFFPFNGSAVRTLDPDGTPYFQGTTGDHFENSLLILHLSIFRL